MFDHYGITVDFRHLSLVADFMTHNGRVRPFTRIGINEFSSPLLKMSFETTGAFLTKACMNEEFDNSSSVSASLVFGTVPKVGTGAFEVYPDGSA